MELKTSASDRNSMSWIVNQVNYNSFYYQVKYGFEWSLKMSPIFRCLFHFPICSVRRFSGPWLTAAVLHTFRPFQHCQPDVSSGVESASSIVPPFVEALPDSRTPLLQLMSSSYSWGNFVNYLIVAAVALALAYVADDCPGLMAVWVLVAPFVCRWCPVLATASPYLTSWQSDLSRQPDSLPSPSPCPFSIFHFAEPDRNWPT